MNIVLTLTSNVPGPMVGMINILLVFVLVLAAILLIIAFFLIRSSRRTIDKYAYEQQTTLKRLQETSYQDAEAQQSLPSAENKQEQQGWSPSIIAQPQGEEGQLKQCPFCGTEVLPGGSFCLYCGQRLPKPGSATPLFTEQREEQVSTPIWGEPTQISLPEERDDEHARAIEEHPTLIGDVPVIAEPEKQEAEEPPVQIEDVKTVPVARLEHTVEEQPTQGEERARTDTEEQQSTGTEEEREEQKEKQEAEVAAGNHEAEEPPTLIEGGEVKAEPEEESEKQSVQSEEEELPTEDAEVIKDGLEKEEIAEQEKRVEEEQQLTGIEEVEEEQKQEQASSSPVLTLEEVAEQGKQEEKSKTESRAEESREKEVTEREKQEEQEIWKESSPASTPEPPMQIEEVATPYEERLREEEQPAQPAKVEEEYNESQKKWIEEQPTRIEMPAVTVAKQEEEPDEISMVEQSGYLILRKLNGKSVREYPLNRPAITIGRARDNDIVIPRDKLTSRHHATIRYEHGHYALYDEHSANGTFVNGEEIEAGTPYVLQDADAIGVGAYEFTYRTASALMKEVDHVSTAKVSVVTGEEKKEDGQQKMLAVQEEKTEPDISIEEDEDENPDEITGREKAIIVAPAHQPDVSNSVRVLEIQRTPMEADKTLLEPLRFTAYHPQEVAVETWNTLLVYAYIESALQAVYQDVNLLLREMGSGVHRASGSLANGAPPLLPPGTNITVVPECRGVLFNPRRVTLQWAEDWHRAIFRFSARRDMAGLSRNGRINIFIGPLLVGTLRMAMLFEQQERIDPLLIDDAAITVKPYRRIYTSYSHYDHHVMRASQEMYRMLGFNTLLKIDQMRANQALSETVRSGIEQAEVFQLFWSGHAAKSAFVQQEWEYALQLNRGEGFMRPVYWEVPLVKPPDMLTPFYFSYLPTYAFASS